MGWYYTYGADRQDIIRELTETRNEDGTKWETLAKFCNGYTQLFAVKEVTKPDGTKVRHIGVYLLQGSREGWGYKPMDEGMHPYFYACPLKYLAMVPEECKEWREGVRSYWARRAERRKAHAVSRVPV